LDLCDALRGALYVYEELEDLEAVFDRFSVRQLALMILGLDKVPRGGTPGNRSYLTRRRQLERYRAGIGRGPRGGKQTRAPRDVEAFLDGLRERIGQRRPPRGQARTVTIKGEVKISNDRRHRPITQKVPGACIDEVVDLLEEDLCDEAVEAFQRCFGQAAGMGATPEWTDVDELVAR
jgi:hypothetical protein